MLLRAMDTVIPTTGILIGIIMRGDILIGAGAIHGSVSGSMEATVGEAEGTTVTLVLPGAALEEAAFMEAAGAAAASPQS